MRSSGMAIICGAAIALSAPATAATYQVIHAFGGNGDGSVPTAAMIDVGGILYGTTTSGGIKNCVQSGCGTVFAIDPATGSERVVYAFRGGSDGYDPEAALISIDGLLYGTTFGSDNSNHGTIFSVDPATGIETLRYGFPRDPGYHPNNALTQVGKFFYSTTDLSANTDDGALFRFNPSNGKFLAEYHFVNQNAGFSPEGTLLRQKNVLYGVTQFGGMYEAGCIYSFDLVSHAYTPLTSFGEYNRPLAGPIRANGKLYGTTLDTVYAFDPSSGRLKVLHSFTAGADGDSAVAPVIDVGGTLYGTTQTGGGSAACYNGCGTVFSYNLATGAYAVLHAFQGGTDGAGPEAGLVDVNGTLYGTTSSGGGPTGSGGTVFALTP